MKKGEQVSLRNKRNIGAIMIFISNENRLCVFLRKINVIKNRDSLQASARAERAFSLHVVIHHK